MERRDYIMRMIEQFGQVAVALRKMILGGRGGTEEVQQQLRSMARHAGVDLDVVRLATAETLTLFIAPGGELDAARCWMYAETLLLDGLDSELNGDADRALGSYHKARALFSLVAPMGAFLTGFPEAGERIEEIDGRVAALEDPDADESSGGPVRRTRRPRMRRAGVRGA